MSVLMALMKGRRSIRKYQRRRVERVLIDECLDAARYAPSAENAQPWRFLVIDDERLKERVAEVAFSGIYRISRFAGDAPVLILALAKPAMLPSRIGRHIQGTEYHLLDMGIAGEHLVLRATELGLGTCWVGWFNARGIRRLLKIPRRYKICYIIALGYPGESPRKRPRRPLDEIRSFNRLP